MCLLGLIYVLNLANSNIKIKFQPQVPIEVAENGDSFDILDFWQDEILRVNNTLLNIVFGDNSSLEYTNPYTQQYFEFITQEISFVSPNWVNATPENLTLHGFLLYPEEVKASNPGCLCMHGLNEEVESVFKIAYPYLEKGFIVLCYSHPGHGKSEGAQPSPSNIYFEAEYNKSAHFYLTLCGAIQGLRVLENNSLVNNSNIMVTGISYGGFNSMWLAGICGERISGVIPYLSIGDIEKNLAYPNKLIFWILGKKPSEIPLSYRENQLLRFDPIYYLKSPKLPPIMWQIGTNDDFFHYDAIKGTYDAVQHSNKFLQIYPNEHHGFPGYENATKYFIDYVLYNQSAPPNITLQEVTKNYGLIGDILNVKVNVESNVTLESVRVYYKYKDIVGACWQKLELTKSTNNSWSVRLNPWIINSKIDFFITVELEGEGNIWFSSNIYSGGLLISNYTIPFLVLIAFFIILPVILTIWRRNAKISVDLDGKLHIVAKKYYKIELSLLGITELIFYLSLILPWISYESGGIHFTHIYFFNNLFTWKLFIGEISPLSTFLFFFGWIIYSNLSLFRPIVSGIIKIIYPIVILVFFGVITGLSGIVSNSLIISNFGLIYPGVGLFLMLFASLTTIFIGIWKRKYQKKLGIKKAKKFNLKKSFKKIIQRGELRNRN